MAKKIGLNVALGLNTSGFSRGLDKSRGDMRKFAADIKRQNEFASKLGLGGFGRGFGIAGGALEAMSMGGVGGAAAAVALPMAALAGTVALMDGINQFRRDAVKHMAEFNKDMAKGNVGQLITDQMSAFAILAAQQQAIAGPGMLSTFMQSFASGQGGQNFLMGGKALMGGLGEFLNMVMEDPTNLSPLGFLTSGGIDRVTSAMDVGMAQNTAQGQSAAAALEEARKQSSLLERLANLFGGT
jgi:hypothetical protein